MDWGKILSLGVNYESFHKFLVSLGLLLTFTPLAVMFGLVVYSDVTLTQKLSLLNNLNSTVSTVLLTEYMIPFSQIILSFGKNVGWVLLSILGVGFFTVGLWMWHDKEKSKKKSYGMV